MLYYIDDIQSPFNNAVVTIGNFDGVHVGHQTLFRKAIEKARAINGAAIAMTFEPHPAKVLGRADAPPLITLFEQKIELISKTGMDAIICVPFTREFASISPDAFIEDLLVRKIGMKAIVVGEDYSYGKKRQGNLATLRSDARRLEFEIILVPGIQLPGQKASDRISSTRIRELVMGGKLEEARRLLGRHYQVRGDVVHGRDRGGKLLGFPTANIHLADELCPKTGVYAVTAECRGTQYQGVANIGYSPTFDDHLYTLEVHLLDFSGDIYGEKMRVNFIDRIRDEVKFENFDQLTEQINKDTDAARHILSP
jgi:riboflavin kinase/FMN adenylyltransferase